MNKIKKIKIKEVKTLRTPYYKRREELMDPLGIFPKKRKNMQKNKPFTVYVKKKKS